LCRIAARIEASVTVETSEDRPKWAVIVPCILLTFCFGPFFTITVFFSEFEDVFRWSRTLISTVQATVMLGGPVSNILVGWLTDRYGTRPPLFTCSLLLGFGLALVSQTQSFGQLLAFYAIASLGIGAIYVVPTATVQRLIPGRMAGLALGLSMAGIPASKLVFVPMTSFLISAIGWRGSYIVLGVAVWAIVSIAAILIPSHRGEKPLGTRDAQAGSSEPILSDLDTVDNSQVIAAAGQTSLKSILITKSFFLSIILFLPLLANQIILVHIVPFAEGAGISKTAAATAVGLMGAFGVAGSIVWPILSRRISWRWIVCITAVGCFVTMAWLPAISSVLILSFFTSLYGFFFYGNAPARLGLLRYLFGTRWLASIIGISIGMGALLSSAGPVLGGYIYDETGSYTIPFLLGAGCWAMAALVTTMLKRPVLPQYQFGAN